MSFFKRLFGKPTAKTAEPSKLQRVEMVSMDGNEFPLVTEVSQSAEGEHAPIRVTMGGKPFLVASSVDEYCKWSDAEEACVMFIRTRDYMNIKLKAYGYFAPRYGGEPSRIAKAMTQAKIFCTSCKKQFHPMVMALGNAEKCAECGGEYSLFTTTNIETITK